jgi:hypothetical protein
MLYGSFNTNVGMIKGILQGMYIGQSVAWTGLFFQSVKFAFSNSALWGVITFFGCYPIGFLVFVFQDFEERKEQFFQIVVGTLISVFVFILCLVGGVSLYLAEMPESNQPAPAQVERPAEPDAAAPKVEPAAPNDRPVLPDSEPGPQ